MPSPVVAYNPHTVADRAAMLEAIGVSSFDELLDFVPPRIRLQRPLNLPDALSEWELAKHMRSLAARNATTENHLSLLGGGAYEHFIPAVVDAIASRGEFLTAYTPYQPEISQGLLRVLFDFQRVLGNLLRMPVVNCSVYDGATALAESAWMAVSIRKASRIVVSDALWPECLAVLRTYLRGRGVEIVTVPAEAGSGRLDLPALRAALSARPASAVVLQTPNRFGILEPVEAAGALAHEYDSLLNVHCYPVSLGLLKSPGEQGADIVHCEGQSLGLKLNAGGPYLGIVATREEFIDFLPGRLVGECQDIKGEHALSLIRQEREQHVRRHEATSHICSNQALLALRCLVHLTALGEEGLRRVAGLSAAKARYLLDRLARLPGVRRAHTGPFFNEFLLEFARPVGPLLAALEREHIFGGVDISSSDPRFPRHLLVAVTETKSRPELDRIADAFGRHLSALSRS